MPRRYLIETFGCQMNFHDSERMAGLLESAGYEPADEPADADVVVLNTSTVREKAEDKVLSRIGELRGEARPGGESPVIAVAGCMAQQEGATLFRRARAVDVVVGTMAERRLPMLLDEAFRSKSRQIDVNPYVRRVTSRWGWPDGWTPSRRMSRSSRAATTIVRFAWSPEGRARQKRRNRSPPPPLRS